MKIEVYLLLAFFLIPEASYSFISHAILLLGGMGQIYTCFSPSSLGILYLAWLTVSVKTPWNKWEGTGFAGRVPFYAAKGLY
jgi:hypothetical protein